MVFGHPGQATGAAYGAHRPERVCDRSDVHTHHILLDGGATGTIEADLARYLTTDPAGETPVSVRV